MRITDQQLFNNFLRAFGNNRNQTATALEQLADGKRVRVPSDDPAGARTALQLRGRLARLEGYTRTGESIRSDLITVENTLAEAFDITLRARSQAQLGASSTSKDAGEALALEVEQLHAQLLQLGNTYQNDRYLFGGTETLTVPFDAGGTYQGNADEVSGPLDEDQDVPVTVAGDRAFQGAGDIFQTLEDLATALRAEDPVTIQGLLPDLSAQLDNFSQVRADVGARLNLVDGALSRHQDESFRLSSRIVEIEGADLERVAFDLTSANNANQALSTAAASILGTSLFDFLG